MLHLIQPIARIFSFTAAAAVLAACTGGSEPVRTTGTSVGAVPENVLNPAVFDVGLERIANFYVDEVDLGLITTDGLKGFSTLDPAIAVHRVGTAVELSYGGIVIESFAQPRSTDSRAWSSIVTLMVDSAAEVSPIIGGADPETIYAAFYESLLEDLDPYSRYSGAEQAQGERARRDGYGGVGLTIETTDDGLHFVRQVFRGGPAAAAGVVADSEILAIDSVPTTGMDIREVGDRVRGPIDSTVELRLGLPDGNDRVYSIMRARVIPDTVATRFEGNVGIVQISGFNAGTATDVVDALGEVARTLPSPEGLILDLRGNPGGLLDQAVNVADIFISGGEIIHTRGRHPNSGTAFNARIRDLMVGVPIVILMDGGSASGAEVVAGAMQDVGRAVVVGASSFGKGSIQTVSRLPNDGELLVTWSRIFVPSGYSFHEQGILPSICTSTGLSSADAVINAFRSGRLEAPARLHTFRERAHIDPAAREILRNACPWQEHDAELDVEVAISILNDRSLFARALAAADVGGSVAIR